jgi:hypothetical protein
MIGRYARFVILRVVLRGRGKPATSRNDLTISRLRAGGPRSLASARYVLGAPASCTSIITRQPLRHWQFLCLVRGSYDSSDIKARFKKRRLNIGCNENTRLFEIKMRADGLAFSSDPAASSRTNRLEFDAADSQNIDILARGARQCGQLHGKRTLLKPHTAPGDRRSGYLKFPAKLTRQSLNECQPRGPPPDRWQIETGTVVFNIEEK